MRNIPKFFFLSLALLFAAILLFPHFTQASLGLSFLTTPFGGKIITIIPNPPALPTVPPVPNPCYKPNTYLVTIGPPSSGEYVLSGTVDVINGTNPPSVGVWSLGLASQGMSVCKEIDDLIGVSGFF